MDKYRIPIKIDKTVHNKDVKESTQNHNPDSQDNVQFRINVWEHDSAIPEATLGTHDPERRQKKNNNKKHNTSQKTKTMSNMDGTKTSEEPRC